MIVEWKVSKWAIEEINGRHQKIFSIELPPSCDLPWHYENGPVSYLFTILPIQDIYIEFVVQPQSWAVSPLLFLKV